MQRMLASQCVILKAPHKMHIHVSLLRCRVCPKPKLVQYLQFTVEMTIHSWCWVILYLRMASVAFYVWISMKVVCVNTFIKVWKFKKETMCTKIFYIHFTESLFIEILLTDILFFPFLEIFSSIFYNYLYLF